MRKLFTEPVQVVARLLASLTNVQTTSCEVLPALLTIADLDESQELEVKHVLEALQYRVQV